MLFKITTAIDIYLTEPADRTKNKASQTIEDAKANASVGKISQAFGRQKLENKPSIVSQISVANGASIGLPVNKNPIGIFRSKARASRKPTLFERYITKFYNNQFLAPAIIIVGSLITYFYAQNNLSSAMITVVTASLASLIFAFRHDPVVRNREEKKETVRRFEQLEDKAWELSESEERYRSIAEAFDDLLVMRDMYGEIVSCNPAFATCFGKSVDQITGTRFTPISKHNTKTNEVLGFGTKEVAFETCDGLKWFSWLDLPVRGENNTGALTLSVARDITPYKIAEQSLDEARHKAEQANRAKSRFLAMVSHEMRTPLNGVLGMSKLLGGTGLTSEQKTYVDSISSSGSSLLHLIEEMLDLTMIEAGRFKLQKQNFDLRQLLVEAVELMSARAYSKNIGLGLYVHSDVPQMVYADSSRLKQIILNLVGNAIKFTQKGGVALHCEIIKIDKAKKTVDITFNVIDTGPGLNGEDQQRIFREFERVDDENTRKAGGAGLGLTISKAIVEQLNGELKLAESNENGSVFSLDLTIDFTPTENSNFKKLLQNKHILLAMGNQMEAVCLQKQIEVNGGAVTHVSSVQALKSTLLEKATQYNSVIFDPLSMTDIDTKSDYHPTSIEYFLGDFQKCETRVIVLMDPAKRKELSYLMDQGADAYLIRPVRESSLINVLTENLPSQGSVTNEVGRQNTISNKQLNQGALLGKRVLLVEDNDINKMMVTACLTKAGASVVHAQNGKIAVEKFKLNDFDVVLMDMHMPVLDGVSAAKQIRGFEKNQNRTNPTNILALTADDQETSRQEAFAAGMNDFLQKPIDPYILIDIVAQYASDDEN